MIFCSFYTVNTPYEKEKDSLVEDLERLNLRYFIKAIDSKGNWVLNTNEKSKVCLEAFDTYKEPVVYVDCDARIRKYPEFFDSLDCDIAVHYRRGRELLSGTLFFNQTEKAREVIQAWVSKCAIFAQVWDQRNLASVLNDVKDVRIGMLPATYVQIFDLMKDAGEPVIEHFQASRRFKRLIR
jgi:hypothetical protein